MDTEYKFQTTDMQILTLANNIRTGFTSKLTWPNSTIISNYLENNNQEEAPTECDVTVTANQSLSLRFTHSSTWLWCDWGDGYAGLINDNNTGATNLFALHTYQNAGDYTIKIFSGKYNNIIQTYTLGKTANNKTYTFLNLDTSSSKSSTTPALIAIRLGTNCIGLNGSAFKGCTELKTISIPNSVATIGTNFLEGCTKLENIITTKNIFSNIPSPLLSLKNIIIKGNSITSFTMPNAVITDRIILGDYVTTFSESTLAESKSIYFGQQINTINWAEAEHLNLSEIHIYNIETWLNTIQNNGLAISNFHGYNLYSKNQLIKKLIIPLNTLSINDYVFKTCTSIEDIYLPPTITTIGEYSFFCPNLQKIYCFGLPPTLETNSFGTNNNLLNNVTIYIYNTYESNYQNDATWSQWSNNFSLLNNGDDYSSPYDTINFSIN